MAGALVGEATIGATFERLFGALADAGINTITFPALRRQLESHLRSAQEIEKINKVLDQKHEMDKLIKILKKGEKLRDKCSKIKWNCPARFYYSYKLKNLNSSIVRYFQVDVQAQVAVIAVETLMGVQDGNIMLRRLSNTLSIGFNQVIGPCSVPDPPEISPGFDVPLKELKMELLKKGVEVIVISAPGGSGKTTLVKKLCKDDQVKGKFKDNIFFVTVSKTPDVKFIVQKISQHKGVGEPNFQTDEEAINYLEQLLKGIGSEPILLVLDDVWSGSESMVQNFKFRLPDYKILVTSRFVFPRFGSGHELKPLNEEAARTVFYNLAILPDGNSYSPNEEIVDKILRACKGSPLALTIVGGLLRGQSAAFWRRRVKEWTQDATIFYSNNDLINHLQSSLNVLNKEVKECYMDLGSFPEDQRIPVTALIDMWSEAYKLVEDFDAINNLIDLSNQNLVNLVVTRKNASDDGCYNDHFVMQHDLLREFIIHQSMSEPIEETKRLFMDITRNKFPEWWLEEKHRTVKARLLSISTDETFSSNWHDLKAPQVEVIVLHMRSKKYTLPNFMKEMDKLKVLIVTNYGFFSTELSDFKLLGSLPNLKRIRLEHVSIPSYDVKTIQMKNLQKMSLVMCNVGQVFRDSTFQISYACPNLEEMDIDYCNDLEELPAGLFEIESIKKLSITNCPKLSALPKKIGKLVNLQVLRLASCINLVALPDTIRNLSNLNSLDISECLSIEELPIQIGELHSLEMMCMRGCYKCELPTSIMNLKNLEVVKCDEETAYNWERFQPHLPKLRVEVVKEDINLNWLF